MGLVKIKLLYTAKGTNEQTLDTAGKTGGLPAPH